MADLTFNTTPGQTVGREMLIAYLNTAEDIGTPKWSAIGLSLIHISRKGGYAAPQLHETGVGIMGGNAWRGNLPPSLEKWLNTGDRPTGRKAVSYTHLDVYKRQGCCCLVRSAAEP